MKDDPGATAAGTHPFGSRISVQATRALAALTLALLCLWVAIDGAPGIVRRIAAPVRIFAAVGTVAMIPLSYVTCIGIESLASAAPVIAPGT
ncbi:hypothetical protein [Burkholderia ubonensis]|uniref:hypothetical protein n=1 Tax=Burkholderia ubonensis TaxID=101571 RepID=UPI0012FC6C0F|nr:hypothetical protein [Burkholderia ubonensis]